MNDEVPKFRVRRVLSKPAAPAAAAPPPHDATQPLQVNRPRTKGAETGRVQFDERGNASWDVGARNVRLHGSTRSLKVLDNPTLSLADDAPTPTEVVKPNPLGTVKGYNPYDSGKLAKKKTDGKKDLRKLSEWIKLRKQAETNDPNEE